jgi:hypothetical protein
VQATVNALLWAAVVAVAAVVIALAAGALFGS